MLTQLQQFSKPIQLVRLWKLLWSRRQHDAYIEHITRRREDMNFIYLRVAKTIFYNWVRAANELPFRCQLFRPANNYFTWKDKCQAKPKIVGHLSILDNGQSKIFHILFWKLARCIFSWSC
jgi:hypothetical protein